MQKEVVFSLKKILAVHNFYQQPGGEDQVFNAEIELLESKGHSVIKYTIHNDQIKEMSRFTLAGTMLWNNSIYRKFRTLIQSEKPDIVHFHNTFPLISPAAYYAAKAEGAAVVQTLHNYRLLCLNSLFFREGQNCEDCLSKIIPWPGIVHSCYRGSRVASTAVATLLTVHRILGSWKRMIDVYITLSDFAKQKFIEGGIPEEKIMLKPNFLQMDYNMGTGQGGYALYVGRLSKEKGIDTLLAAWRQLNGFIPLKIVGDGPLADHVLKSVGQLKGIEWLGRQSREEVIELMKDALFLVFPSLCYEGFPMTIVEAFSVGLPVIASNLGSITTIIKSGESGLLFTPGDPNNLVSKVRWMLINRNSLFYMRANARKEFETKYTAEINYRMMMDIYQSALNNRNSK